MAKLGPVAVVIPVYNRRVKLIKTLESVAAQSTLPSCLVVVDDGSTDGTADAAKDWLSQNAQFEWQVISQANAGVSVARNAGFACIGELPFVCFLDSDDLWPPGFIAEGLRLFEGREDIVATIADRVNERRGRRSLVQDLSSVSSNPLLWIICNDGGILSCTMIRSRAVREAGPFAPGMHASEDSDFLLRLFLLGGADHSKAGPVLFVKRAPLEPTEPANLSDATPERKILWTRHLITSVSKLPADLQKQHDLVIRSAVAHRWARIAFHGKTKRETRLALQGLVQALSWDYSWERRRRLIWLFLFGKGRTLKQLFPNPFVDHGS